MLKLLETIVDKLDSHDKKFDSLTTDMSHMSTAIEALAEGQKDIRERMATKQDVAVAVDTAKEEIQANILDQGAKITRTLHNHETRIQNLEKHTGTTDPTKN